MTLKRSAGVGAVSLCVALAAGSDAFGHNGGDGAGVRDDHAFGRGPVAIRARVGDDRLARALVVRRGFGATGRNTAPSGGE